MKPSDVTEALGQSTALAEKVLLRVEELELLVSADRPRRLIELAQTELADAVAEASKFWASQEGGLAEEAASSDDYDVGQAWREFRGLLTHSARRAAEASLTIATRLAVCDDALSALGIHHEYTKDGAVHSQSGRRAAAVMA